ncbi:zinc-binding dehydrogenase [Amycolatopsis cihanbeyliensis]|uniref:NADPH2:quinone reductase n=1 Tax=Amycolatopsis cihanbeyliensis TaxID=1128664 RepID=A0A542DK43_AMYCI|nr:zinc-binding dehydrogenase [Amycolatopsis cihanbeyliensis]TQJ03462.1 NADPH2:quinone reductase [Amycolatopsis cihanbeyliensis]
MHAIRQHAFGPAENLRYEEVEDLRYEEVEDPRPGPGEVRVAVSAAGVHVVDTTIRRGDSGGPFAPPELPMTPGREVAGVVDELGAGADGDWLGRRVVVHLGQANGGYAERAVARAESLHALPDGVDEAAAVAMIGTGRTAIGILHVAQLTADDVVLVPAAAGGIGNLLVQEARNLGATVVGLAGGAEKVARVGELGATFSADYIDHDWPERVREWLGGREVTAVLDGVGGRAGRAGFDLLGAGGRIIMFGWAPGQEPVEISTTDLFSRGLTASVALGPRLWQRRPGGLRGLEEESLAALGGGRLTPLVNEPFALAEAAAAHTALESRRTTGKVVLKP